MSVSTAQRTIPDALYRDGAMTMLALDQRGSMRTILAAGGDESRIADTDVSAFKRTATSVLAPLASAVLLDLQFGRDAIAALPKGVPLILSGDKFDQPAGQAVSGSVVDPDVTVEVIQSIGAKALKFLVIWKDGAGLEARTAQVSRFMGLARSAGVISLLEPIVRTANDEPFPSAEAHGQAVLAAARELKVFGPDVYKAEVPGYRRGDLSAVLGFSRQLTELLDCPWVVLSSGVDAADFPEAVRLAVAGGASGFLAGRAIWADAARSDNPAQQITDLSIGRFQRLIDNVHSGKTAR